MSQQEWLTQGIALAAIQNKNQWDVADWLMAGDSLYPTPGASLDAAQELFRHFSRHTLTVYKRIAKIFPVDTRNFSLTFTHYAIVADIQLVPTEETLRNAAEKLSALRQSWLARAVEHGLSCAALRFAIQNPDGGNPQTEPDQVQPVEVAPSLEASQPQPQPVKSIKQAYSLPLAAKYRDQLAALASARGITPAALAAQAVTEYLESHGDESAEAAAAQRAEYEKAQAALDAYHAEKLATCKAQQIKWEARKQAKADFESAVDNALPGDYGESRGQRDLVFGQARDWLAANPNADADTVRAELMPLIAPAVELALAAAWDKATKEDAARTLKALWEEALAEDAARTAAQEEEIFADA